MQPAPEQVARYTVDQNGGEYTTDVTDVLTLFGCQQLTDTARGEIRNALQSVDVGTDPDLLVAKPADTIRLFLLQREWVAATPEKPRSRPTSTRSWRERLRPHTWKGWLVYGFLFLVIVGALTQNSDEPKQAVPAAQPVEQSAPAKDSEADAAARRVRREARREQARLRRERAEFRRERAAARRALAQARRERAAARRERERQAELAAEAAAAAEPEPEPQAAGADCHPSYDPCLDPNASDYDCEGGSGDGPEYTGLVTVKGPDDFDLDRDGDGTGCDS